MKLTTMKCDWCGEQKSYSHGTPVDGWTERAGKIPEIKRDPAANEKYFIVAERTLHFCQDKCNQIAKDAEAASDKAGERAWLAEYNKRHA